MSVADPIFLLGSRAKNGHTSTPTGINSSMIREMRHDPVIKGNNDDHLKSVEHML